MSARKARDSVRAVAVEKMGDMVCYWFPTDPERPRKRALELLGSGSWWPKYAIERLLEDLRRQGYKVHPQDLRPLLKLAKTDASGFTQALESARIIKSGRHVYRRDSEGYRRLTRVIPPRASSRAFVVEGNRSVN